MRCHHTVRCKFTGTVPCRAHQIKEQTSSKEIVMNQQNFETLKQKYASVLTTIQEQGVQLGHLHEENGKLIIAGKAPSDQAKNKVWDTIKRVDAAYKDVQADITVDPSIASNQASSLPPSPHLNEEQTYTVKAG